LRPGVCLGIWRHRRHEYLLRDTSSSHVLAFAPTRSGKGVGIVIPTLLTWPHSALVHDIKGENWALTAGRRASMGQVCLKFDPTDPSGASVRYNPLEQIRLRTPYEAEDTQNVVQMIVDPNSSGLNSHWLKTGAAMLTGTVLHVLYSERAKTLRGVVGLLTDPGVAVTDTFSRMMATEHDPDGSMGWTDYRGQPTRTHPIVAESMREVLSRSENERSSVFSTATSFFDLYRDPIIAANTETSEFRIQDLMNHERPVSLYIVVPLASKDRLRPLIRMMLNQVLRTLTTTMKYANGRAVANYKHRLLLMIDEFPTLGPLDVFHEALSLVAGYGIKACLIAQDLSQIHATYGHDESITSNCHTRVAFTPNRIETAKLLSMMAGETTVRRTQVTVSGRSSSVSEPESPRPLLTSDEAMRLPKHTALIFTTGHPAIWARKLRYYQHATMERWAKIPPPEVSDHIIEAKTPRVAIAPKKPPEESSPAQVPDWLDMTGDHQKNATSLKDASAGSAKATKAETENRAEPSLEPARRPLRLL
jgi:type IV secretion system protein VirD4